MDSGYWQSQFEDWLRHHHQEQDAAHDISHFRRVWATAQTLGENSPVDWLVVLSACYFHDIVSLAKIIRSGIVLPFWRRQKPGVFFCGIFLTFRQKTGGHLSCYRSA